MDEEGVCRSPRRTILLLSLCSEVVSHFLGAFPLLFPKPQNPRTLIASLPSPLGSSSSGHARRSTWCVIEAQIIIFHMLINSNFLSLFGCQTNLIVVVQTRLWIDVVAAKWLRCLSMRA